VTAGGICHVAGAEAFLNVDRASHRLDRAWKFGKNRIAGGVEDAAAVPRNEVVGDLTVGREAP